MEKLSDGQAMDRILEYCLNKEERCASPYDITNNAFESIRIEEVMYLLRKIDEYNRGIAKVDLLEDQEGIYCTNLTEEFLKKGGFTAIENNQYAEDEKEKERSQLEVDNYIAAIQLAKDNLKYNRFSKRVAILNVVLTAVNIALIIWQIVSINSRQ